MGRLITVLKSMGFGAGLMYLYDPERGVARRENISRRLTDPLTNLGDSIDSTAYSVGQQAKAFASEPTAVLARDPSQLQAVGATRPADADWMLPTRLLLGGVGGWLATSGLRRGGIVGWTAAAAGSALLWRSVTERKGERRPKAISAPTPSSGGRLYDTLGIVQTGKRLDQMISGNDPVLEPTTPVIGETLTPGTPAERTVPPAMRVRDLMNRKVAVVHPDDRLQTAAEKMKELGVGALPVDDGSRLLGMVTEHDIMNRAVARGVDPWEAKVSTAMTDAVIYTLDDSTPDEALQIMQANNIRRLVVMDTKRQMVGIVSRDDLLGLPHDRDRERDGIQKEDLGSKR